jgi:WD40 repeat protein
VSCEAYTISGSGDGEITLWPNDETDPRPTILKKSAIGIHHLAIDNGGKILCAVGFDGRLQLYDLQKLQPIEADGKYFK